MCALWQHKKTQPKIHRESIVFVIIPAFLSLRHLTASRGEYLRSKVILVPKLYLGTHFIPPCPENSPPHAGGKGGLISHNLPTYPIIIPAPCPP